MTLKKAICRGKVRTVEDAVEAWKVDHDNAMQVRDAEDLIELCLDLFRSVCSWEKEAVDDLLAGRVEQVHKTGADIRTCLERSLELASRIEECIRDAEAHGYTVDLADEFKQEVNKLRAVQTDFLARWPFISEQEVKAARARLAQGQFLTAKEILGEVRGDS